ncbi:CPBP family intramembrane glutamic endopeptidase [Pseudoxanthomonas daejeonensis]|uniref:CPBP family intramembrane glutamic endopeptidase n=1 Tax=Pseudoxanthomonas daejeonensis TaxID=266062 RepID=UPI003CE55DB2
MSDPAGGPPAAVSSSDIAAAGFPPLASRTGPLVRAFLLDIAIAIIVLLVASLASGIAWGVWRVVVVVQENGGQAPEAAAIAGAIGEPGALAQILMAAVGMSAAALVLYLVRRRATAVERRQSMAALRRRSTWSWTVLVGVAVFAGSTLLGYLMQLAGSEPVPTNMALVEEAARHWPFVLVVFAVVLAPAYEELLFRRVLFGRFLAAGRPWLGMLLASLAFALVHEVPGLSANPPLAVLQLWLVYGGMGAAFAWLYWRTGTLWAPILAHALNNGLALIVHGLA